MTYPHIFKLANTNIDPINIDLTTLPIYGYKKNTINGIAFTSADGKSSSGFNYSFGIIKEYNNNRYYDAEFIRKHNILPPYNHVNPTEYYPLVKTWFTQLENLGLKLFRARLSVINSMYTIPEHRDTPTDTDYCIKLHIPLQTNDNAKFVFGDIKYKLEAGHAYLADVSKLHSFENLGNESRYHIIADCIVTNPGLPFYCNNKEEILKFYNTWNSALHPLSSIKWFDQRTVIC